MTDLTTIPAVHLATFAEWLRKHRPITYVYDFTRLAGQSETLIRLAAEVEAAAADAEAKHEGE